MIPACLPPLLACYARSLITRTRGLASIVSQRVTRRGANAVTRCGVTYAIARVRIARLRHRTQLAYRAQQQRGISISTLLRGRQCAFFITRLPRALRCAAAHNRIA